MVLNKYIFLYISLFNIIISFKLNVNKKIFNANQLLKYNSFNIKFLSNQYLLRSLINLPIQQSELSLPLVNIKIGEPYQEFSLVLDSGSSHIWVYDSACDSCKAKNKFITSNSKSFISSEENIKINFISGYIKGNLCKDTLFFNKDVNISSFYFLLVNESNINFFIDGIIGLSKGSFNNKYSFLNQLKERKIIKNNLLLYDLSNKSLYIDEIPKNYMEQKSISCKDIDDNSKFWKCKINFIEIDNVSIRMENDVVFDSGTNGIAFPLKYKEYFNNIIKNNKVLNNYECELKYFVEEKVYQIICNKSLEYNEVNITGIFLKFFFDKNQKNSVDIKLTDLLNEDNKSFYLYIIERKKQILLGYPFFVKYPILFDMDKKIINIFGTGNEIFKYNGSYFFKIGKQEIIIILIISILMILILARIQCNYRKNKSYEKFEFLSGEIENL